MTQGSFTIISRFMLTYLTKGPANLSIQTYSILFSLFWGLFIFSRFFSTYLSLKIDPIIFFAIILIVNSIFCALFLVPFLSKYEIFYWIFVPMLGMSSGPLMPCGLMIAKQILDFNSLVLSFFIVGMATGGIICQQLTSEFLDHFKPDFNWMGFTNANSAYSIPHLTFLSALFSLITFIPIYFLYKHCNQSNYYKIAQQRFGL